MASLTERLGNLYGAGGKKEKPKNSWIPQRLSNDPLRNLKKTLAPETHLSQKRSQDLLDEQEGLGAAKLRVGELVAAFLIKNFGEKDLEVKLENFEKSWDDMFDKYGLDLAEALQELAGEQSIVNHEGFIRKAILREKVKEIVKRRKNQ